MSVRSLLSPALPTIAGLLMLLSPTVISGQETPRTVQPGAPGAASRVVQAGDDAFQFPSHSEDDIEFMQMMIAHHAQAMVMSDMVPDRSGSEDVRLLAHRIHLSQRDEMAFMVQWLRDRGASVPDEARVAGLDPEEPIQAMDHGTHAGHAGHTGHAGQAGQAGQASPPAADPYANHANHEAPAAASGHDHGLMAGMLTEAQLAELAAASGDTFDRLFLEFMIYHHEGAILMVEELFASPRGGQEGEIYNLASHVDSDQRIEIDRMKQMLAMRGWN